MAYELNTIGGLAGDDPTPLAAQAGVTPVSLSVTDRVQSVARDVVAQRVGLLVGLAVGAAGAFLYVHLRR